ncbi:membrane protein insertion efficiency factor YidD [candidate division LCP-89 bacterium B3_LCP]|uniref:Membrane protein insertion efficiency factor YidD n=1 Tax=candidate division LCP-89 bacterium B3_LCP TaxID=2012998 RepID=A0A532V4K3_UNCL8|nr:MAG: membrane protein insertion efficiency factor YidD [candidate division LCP-89 bacterium B3_LCP]
MTSKKTAASLSASSRFLTTTGWLRKLSSLLIKLPSRIVVIVLDIYRMSFGISFGGQCRFYPSCSTYARRAFLKNGVLLGGTKILWRLVRCNPFNPGGVDEP